MIAVDWPGGGVTARLGTSWFDAMLKVEYEVELLTVTKTSLSVRAVSMYCRIEVIMDLTMIDVT